MWYVIVLAAMVYMVGVTCPGKSDQTITKEIHCRKLGKDTGREFDGILVTLHKNKVWKKIIIELNRKRKINNVCILCQYWANTSNFDYAHTMP